MKTYKVRLLEEVKKLIRENNGFILAELTYLYYPKGITTFNHFIVRDDSADDHLYQILEPHLYKGLNIWKCHTAPYIHFEFTIDDEVFE